MTKTTTLTQQLDRTQTPQAAAGVPDHSIPFVLARRYEVPYLSLSFNETEKKDLVTNKLQRMNLLYTQLTVQEQLDQADDFDARTQEIKDLIYSTWIGILERRMGKGNAPSLEEFLDNIGPGDCEALMAWLEGREGNAQAAALSPTGTTFLPV